MVEKLSSFIFPSSLEIVLTLMIIIRFARKSFHFPSIPSAMKLANTLADLLAAESSAAVAVKEDDPILTTGLLRGSSAEVVPSIGTRTGVLDNIFEEQVKDASARKEEIDDEEDALEYDFEGKYIEAELGCKDAGQKRVQPLPDCCGDMTCEGDYGNKTCQCQAIDQYCYEDNQCCGWSNRCSKYQCIE